MQEILTLIDRKRYFVLHAPRQTGKTTCLLALMDYLNKGKQYTCLYVNIEAAQAMRGKVDKAMAIVVDAIADAAELYLGDASLLSRISTLKEQYAGGYLVKALLSTWSRDKGKPIVLLLDEVDSLVGDALIALLRQLRSGYSQRPEAFPQAVTLCGVRDVRDYRIQSTQEGIITGGSAFNIKAESLRLGNLTRAEIAILYAQHTEATGQVFELEGIDYVFEQTRGQPWLVNALGYQACFRKENTERSQAITLEAMVSAREQLIHRRDTHLDQLTDKLKEPRIQRVISRLLTGEESSQALPEEDDLQYAEDLGLIARRPQLSIANPIYREIIPRALSWVVEEYIVQKSKWYMAGDSRLQVSKLLKAFEDFYRENAAIWLDHFAYREAAPQLLLQAFLQRIVNSGGRIDREYGLGRRRTDLLLQWPLDKEQGFYGPVQKVVIEVKLLHKSLEQTIATGVPQTGDYMQRCSAEEGYLIIFARDRSKALDQYGFQGQKRHGKLNVGVWVM